MEDGQTSLLLSSAANPKCPTNLPKFTDLSISMRCSRKFMSYLAGTAVLAILAVYAFHSSPAQFMPTPVRQVEEPNLLMRNLESVQDVPSPTPGPASLLLADLLGCHDREALQRYGQRGDYWVLYNYVPAKKWFKCAESITYTTHGDYTFLDNLEVLLSRWQGPLSMSVFSPGTDFNLTLQSIQYVRQCGPKSISDLVTFHLYFPNKHVPKDVPKLISGTKHIDNIKANCSLIPPWERHKNPSYRTTHKIIYPVNVGRNVAREESTTHFVLASDVELYPNPSVIPDFLAMIKSHLEQNNTNNNNKTIAHKVYPLSIFELKDKMSLPQNKSQLVQMLKKGEAVTFHKYVCANCHKVPKAQEWINLPQAPTMHVFHVGKRTGTFLHWEPIYIGTHAEPLYDERLSWEGKSDKMTQGYAMCVMDYEFHILDNAFLVHRPGIKTNHKDKERDLHVRRTQVLIRQQILPELKLLYGTRKGCTV